MSFESYIRLYQELLTIPRSLHQARTLIPLLLHSAIRVDHSCILAASFNSCTPVPIFCPSSVSRLLEISHDGFGYIVSRYCVWRKVWNY